MGGIHGEGLQSGRLMLNASTPVLDAHMHVAGLGYGGTGCFVHPKTLNSLPFHFLRTFLGFTRKDTFERLDELVLQRILDLIREAPSITHGLIFAHDAIIDKDGTRNETLTQFYVPNEYVLKLAREHEELLPAVSIHPHRKDALDRLHECIEAGALALKWLPNSQGMDPSDKNIIPLYDILAEHHIPLICHTGGEHTVRVLDHRLSDPSLLQLPLERGVTVVCAHCATKSGFVDKDYFEVFVEMAKKWPNCYGDTSALATLNRARYLPRIAKMEELHKKLIHGTDFPVPSSALPLMRHFTMSELSRLQRIKNSLERDIQIKRSLGLSEVVFENAAKVFSITRQ